MPELEAILRWTLDKATLDQVKRGVLTVDEALKKTRSSMEEMRRSAERIGQIGLTIGGIGTAIAGPFVLAAREYIQKAGMAESTSRKWLAATNELERSQTRIGRVAAQSILPVLEKIADVAEMAAGFAEKHPGAIQAALGVGGALVTLGAIGMAVSRGIRLYADVKMIATQLLAATTQDGAANKQLMASKQMMGIAGKAALGVGAAVVGANIGLYLGNRINQAANPGAKEQDFGDIGNTALRIAGAGQMAFILTLKKLGLVSDEAGKDIADFYLRLGGMGPAVDQASEGIGSVLTNLSDQQRQALQSYIQFQQAEADALSRYEEQKSGIQARYDEQALQENQQYHQQRNRMITDYDKQQWDAQADLMRSRTRQLRDFMRAERQALEDYFKSRAKAAAQHGVEMARMEQDHQKRMRQLQRDHEDRMDDLSSSRDALGLANELKSYERSRQEEESNYQDDVRRRNEDFANQLAEMEASFAEQRKLRLDNMLQQLQDQQSDFDYQRAREQANFQQQLKDLDEQHAQEQAAMTEQKAKDLEELSKQYQKEKNARALALADEYRLMTGYLGNMTGVMEEWYKVMIANMQKFIDAMPGIGSGLPGLNSVPTRQGGGYVGAAVYRMHPGEFVLTDRTTQYAEQIAGRRLDQDRMMSLLAGVNGFRTDQRMGQRMGSMQQSFRFDSSLTEAERAGLRKMVYETTQAAIMEVLQ